MSKSAESSHFSRPTASELAVLQLLWQRGPLSVREVHEALPDGKPIVYTTVLKTMQVMLDRGFLTRRAEGRKHIYAAAVTEGETQNNLLDNFLHRAFGGSAMSMVMKALGNYDATPGEIEELKAYLDELENGSTTQNPLDRTE
ncbi:MAG: BlaI/MecI/CopY family transcriptional regulator [Saprospiraceae bacterium]